MKNSIKRVFAYLLVIAMVGTTMFSDTSLISAESGTTDEQTTEAAANAEETTQDALAEAPAAEGASETAEDPAAEETATTEDTATTDDTAVPDDTAAAVDTETQDIVPAEIPAETVAPDAAETAATDTAGNSKEAAVTDVSENSAEQNSAAETPTAVPTETPAAEATETPASVPAETQIAYPAIGGSSSYNGVTVTFYAPEGAFKEGTTYSIVPIESGNIDNAVSNAMGENFSGAVAFDITFSY
jgi:hypothetical protein